MVNELQLEQGGRPAAGPVGRRARRWSLRTLYRYSAVSVVTTTVSFSALTVLYGVLHLWSEVPSVFVANLTAALVSYNLNRRWAWGKRGKSSVFTEMAPFLATSGAGMAFSLLAATGAHHVGVALGLHHAARTALVLGANLGAWGTLWFVKFLVFNRLFGQRAHSGALAPDASSA